MLDPRKRKMAKIMLKDPERKNIFKIIYEFVRCSILNKEIAGHYFTRLAYKKDVNNYMDFITNKEMQAIRHNNRKANDPKLYKILDDKELFHKYFSSTPDIRIPDIVVRNEYGKVKSNNKIYEIKSIKDFKYILRKAMERKNVESLLAKPVQGSYGRGCKRISIDSIDEEDDFFEEVLETKYLFQELITNHPVLGKVYPHSLNTLRVDTYLDDEGDANIISAYIRFGANGSIVDNASSGGCFVPVDLKSGKLKEKGYQFLEYGGRTFYKHPETKVVFDELIVPYFEEMKEMIINAVKFLPYKLVGWDVGISEDGPVIIEGNSKYHLSVSDMAYGGFKRHPIYQELLQKYVY